eukprot:5181716-Pleurochrysis_carterae.AAC.1
MTTVGANLSYRMSLHDHGLRAASVLQVTKYRTLTLSCCTRHGRVEVWTNLACCTTLTPPNSRCPPGSFVLQSLALALSTKHVRYILPHHIAAKVHPCTLHSVIDYNPRPRIRHSAQPCISTHIFNDYPVHTIPHARPGSLPHTPRFTRPRLKRRRCSLSATRSRAAASSALATSRSAARSVRSSRSHARGAPPPATRPPHQRACGSPSGSASRRRSSSRPRRSSGSSGWFCSTRRPSESN